MKARNYVSLIFAIISLVANMLLLYSITPKNFLFGYDYAIVLLGFVGFFSAIFALYFGIPYFDDETNSRHPITFSLFMGLSLGFINFIGVIVLTPLVFVVWGAGGLQTIVALSAILF